MKDISKFLAVLDAGHGGISPEGQYTTYPAKCFKFPVIDGQELHGNGWFFEGVFNRKITNLVKSKLDELGVPVVLVSHEFLDVSLGARVRRTNLYSKGFDHALFISNHANASPTGKARGFEVYTSPGQKISDKVATDLVQQVKKLIGKKITNYRTDTRDGDEDKEANFFVLKCDIPSILVEWLFFDNYQDALLLVDEELVNLMAQAEVNAICNHALKLGYLVPGFQPGPEVVE